jgi:hypothetical protein
MDAIHGLVTNRITKPQRGYPIIQHIQTARRNRETPFGVMVESVFNNQGLCPWLLKGNHFVVKRQSPSSIFESIYASIKAQ